MPLAFRFFRVLQDFYVQVTLEAPLTHPVVAWCLLYCGSQEDKGTHVFKEFKVF